MSSWVFSIILKSLPRLFAPFANIFRKGSEFFFAHAVEVFKVVDEAGEGIFLSQMHALGGVTYYHTCDKRDIENTKDAQHYGYTTCNTRINGNVAKTNCGNYLKTKPHGVSE